MDVRATLRSSYLRLAAPGATAVAVAWSVRHWRPEPLASHDVAALAGPVVLVLSAAAALALPLWQRARFVYRVKDRKNLALDEFLRFERGQLALVMCAVYPALIGYLLDVSRFHFTGAFLLALYGAYYYFPSRRRVAHEMRLFRVATSPVETGPGA